MNVARKATLTQQQQYRLISTTRIHSSQPQQQHEFSYPQSHYFQAVNETIDGIAHQIEDLYDDGAFMIEKNTDVDVTHSEGVLTITVGKDVFIISRQTPSRQLWLSSAISGPWHYTFDHINRDWICTKGDLSFYDRLDTEFSQTFKVDIKLDRINNK